MEVNVFISKHHDDTAPSLLVIPAVQSAMIPKHLRGIEWRHVATTTTEDKLLGATATDLEAGIDRDGYAVVAPTG